MISPGFVDDDGVGFHYPDDVVDGGLDVGEGVAVDDGEVGGEVGGDGAKVGGFVEEGGGGGGGGLEGLLGGHAGFDEPGEFAGVFAEHGVVGSLPMAIFTPAGGRGGQAALDEGLNAIFEAGSVGDFVAVVDAIADVIDSGSRCRT
jgi:hypothetical protein